MKQVIIFLLLILSSSLGVNAYGRIAEDKYAYQTMHVDCNNTLWIGTESGLLKWKNSASVRIPLSSNLNISAISSCNNTLIIGTISGEIYTYEIPTKKLLKMANMKAEISDIQYANNFVVISTKGNVIGIITNQLIKIIDKRNGLSDNFIYSTQIDNDHKIWVSSDRGINLITPSYKVISFFANNQLPDKLIRCTTQRDSLLYCGTQQGDVCKLNLNDSTITRFDNSYWDAKQINDIKLLDHSLAIATDKGAYLFDLNGNLIQTIIENKSIQKIEIDKEANLWFCNNQILITSYGEQIQIIKHKFIRKIFQKISY